MKYRTEVVMGEELRAMAQKTRPLQTRDGFAKLQRYLFADGDWARGRVCALYGLKSTGKTTMLFQAVDRLPGEAFAQAAYIRIKETDVMEDLVWDLKALREGDVRYVFVDEATQMRDFADAAAVLSDLYAMMGMKIVLSADDSLCIWLAKDNALYDRVRIVHTTVLPFREYSRLMGAESIDTYLRWSGVLCPNDAMGDPAAMPFRDAPALERYVNKAICWNIQYSLDHTDRGSCFGPLQDLFRADILMEAIRQGIAGLNRNFLTDVLRTASPNLLETLEKRDKAERPIAVTTKQAARILEHLKGMDVLAECPAQNGEMGLGNEERLAFTQPGLRYCQVETMVESLLQDEALRGLTQDEKSRIEERVLTAVRERMMQDLVLLEIRRALSRRQYQVLRYRFAAGAFDMVIRDCQSNTCAVYTVSHSTKSAPEQTRCLRDETMLSRTERRMGELVGRYVLYLGDDLDTEDGIAYRNVEQFLKRLPEVEMASGLEKEIPKAGP